jgi:hypothetical protein
VKRSDSSRLGWRRLTIQAIPAPTPVGAGSPISFMYQPDGKRARGAGAKRRTSPTQSRHLGRRGTAGGPPLPYETQNGSACRFGGGRVPRRHAPATATIQRARTSPPADAQHRANLPDAGLPRCPGSPPGTDRAHRRAAPGSRPPAPWRWLTRSGRALQGEDPQPATPERRGWEPGTRAGRPVRLRPAPGKSRGSRGTDAPIRGWRQNRPTTLIIPIPGSTPAGAMGTSGTTTLPQAIPQGLTRECVLAALADLDAGVEHPFGQPTGYELVHEGKRYPPKAVVGLACRSLLGRILRPDEFSGGEAPGQANHVLRELGFVVVHEGQGMPAGDPGTRPSCRPIGHRGRSSSSSPIPSTCCGPSSPARPTSRPSTTAGCALGSTAGPRNQSDSSPTASP